MTDESLINKSGASINKKNLDSSIILPPTGTANQILQFVGTVLTAQDLKLATKAIDNTVIPSDGWVLTYDNASGKVKFKAVSSGGMSEVQFLASQAALGNLISTTGTVSGAGAGATITSYTPAIGKTFTLYRAGGSSTTESSTRSVVVNLRNNGTVLAVKNQGEALTAVGQTTVNWEFPTKGDQLLGDGIKIYDIVVGAVANAANDRTTGNIIGYIQ